MSGARRLVLAAGSDAEGQRLDAFLAGHPSVGISRARLKQLIKQGSVTVGGRSVKPSRHLKAGEEVCVELPELKPPGVEAEPIELEVLFEDEHFLVVNKPAGMVVHPAGRIRTGTLVNALLHHCAGELSGIGGVERPGIVHRLDKETSGLIIAAKNDRAHASLTSQFAGRTVDKHYRAIALGVVERDEGWVEEPVGRNPRDRKRMAVVEGGRQALTRWRVLERFLGHTYLELELKTGRTHQIRVHMAYIGHPVLGDATYGGRRSRRREGEALIGRQALHAWRLAFDHPSDGRRMAFEAPPPEDFERALASLRSGG